MVLLGGVCAQGERTLEGRTNTFLQSDGIKFNAKKGERGANAKYETRQLLKFHANSQKTKKLPHTNFLNQNFTFPRGGGFPVQRKMSHRMTREKNFSLSSFKVCLSLHGGGGGIPVSPSSSAAEAVDSEADNSKKEEEDPGDQGFFLVRGCLVTRGGGGGGGGR